MSVKQIQAPQGIDIEPRPIENYDTHYTAKFEIKKTGAEGVVHISNGGISWTPHGGEESWMNWSKFARLMAEHG